MKKQKPKPAAKNVPGCSEPTPYELAMLATAVSQESTLDKLVFAIRNQGTAWSTPDHPAEFWVKEALSLWLNAHGVLEKWRNNPADVFPKPAPEPSPEPEPKSYPVTLDKFLRLMVPHLTGRTGEKYGLFREYLAYRLRNPSPPNSIWAYDSKPKNPIPFDCLNPQIVPAIDDLASYSLQNPKPAKLEPTKENVDRYFALWNTKGIPDRNSFHYHKRWFRDWYQTKHATELSAAKAENAFKKHAKKKLHRHLWEKSRQANPKNKVPLKKFLKVTDEQMAQLLELNNGKPLKDYKTWDYNIAAT